MAPSSIGLTGGSSAHPSFSFSLSTSHLPLATAGQELLDKGATIGCFSCIQLNAQAQNKLERKAIILTGSQIAPRQRAEGVSNVTGEIMS